jgi:Flp pilus assembly protein TadG
MHRDDSRADTDVDREAAERQRAKRDEGGFVLPWFALMLVVLVAMAGFGVDVWNWWYTAQKVQRAADAGALAGVVFMPDNPPVATTTAQAAAGANGFASSAVNVTPGTKTNQLNVSVTQTVSNSFSSLVGFSSTTITRSATAEFNAPIKMGSPVPHIANDPENPPVDQHWLNIGAPAVNKQTGDRYADYQCSGAYQCASGKNGEYIDNNYIFTVEVATGGGDVDIQAYDPEYFNAGGTCDNGSAGTSSWTNMTPANIASLQAANPSLFGADSPARYGQGTSMWCPGDDNTALGTPQSTVWLVRGTDGNAFQPLTNSVIAGCAKQFKGYTNVDLYNMLNPSTATDPDFPLAFHRWYTLCHITGIPAGRYFIQVRSNVPLQANPSVQNLSKSETPPEDQTLAGQNRYSLRVVNHGTSSYASGVSVFAETHLPIFSNVLSNTNPPATPQFFLARLLPGGGAAGRKLFLDFYDIGDVGGGTTTITITPPSEMTTTTGVSCAWKGNDGAMPTSGTISGCVVSGITSSTYPSGYNGTKISAIVSIPGDYSCNTGDPFGCWFHIQMSYTSGTLANDTTTWDASISGDPVRLIK